MTDVVVFGPNPILTVTIETRPGATSDDVHLHAGGQGVWVARMAAELGADTLLCGLIGGEVGAVLSPLLAGAGFRTSLVPSTGGSGSYVIDRRDGQRRPVATAWSPAPSRHELDDLVSVTLAAARHAAVVVVANPLPGDALPVSVYADVVAEARAGGAAVLVDLSSPRLDAALTGAPDLVKLNDWELAEYVTDPVEPLDRALAAARRLRTAGARSVLVTRGGRPALAIDPAGEPHVLTPPRFEHGCPEGCGDSMMGGLAAAWAAGADWPTAVRRGAAAGAANYLRRGAGTASAPVVEQLVDQVRLTPASSGAQAWDG